MYKLTDSDIVIRVSDGAYIPAALGNMDHATYLEWVADGNTPQPADKPDPAIAARAAAKKSAYKKLAALGLTADEIAAL